MAGWLEIAMCVMLDASLCFITAGIIKDGGFNKAINRFAAFTFGIGFLIGLISKFVLGGGFVIICLYALGFMLSYAAVIFSVPEKRKRNDRR